MATNENTPSDESTLFGGETTTGSETPPPRKRAPRRSTRKQAAPAPAAPPEETEPATSDQPSAPDDAAKKPARKRASRKKAAAATEQVEVPADPSGQVLARPDQPGQVADEANALEEASEHVLAQPDVPEPEAVLAEAVTQAPEEAVTEVPEPTAPVVPSFSVLFQAPEPTVARRRSRRPEPEPEPEPDGAATDPESAGEQTPAPSGAGEDQEETPSRSRRRRGGKGRRGRSAEHEGDEAATDQGHEDHGPSERAGGEAAHPGSEATAETGAETGAGDSDGSEPGDEDEAGTSRRRRRRRRSGSGSDEEPSGGSSRSRTRSHSDEPVGVKGSTRLEAKKQRRREGREAGRRRTIITEAEFLARRESVERVMVVRNRHGRTQMGVLEDGVLVEHYIDQATNVSMAGNIYLGRVQNVLPSMEAAFVDIGKGRNAVLYAGEVNWDAAGLDSNQPKRIENALESGQTVLVQVTKDPIGHKGARLTSQISLPGRYLVYVPNSSMTGISRKLPDTERARLKKILREVVPEHAGVIVRTAAEGASETELRADVERLAATWEDIQARAEEAASPKAGKSKGRKKNGGAGSSTSGSAPMLLHGEPDLTVRVIRDVFNEDFKQLLVSGEQAWQEIHPYISSVAPDLAERVSKWTGPEDLFTQYRVDEQIAKAMDRKVWLPSGGSLVIDRTEAMTVIDVNTGKFIGSGGNLEETVTKNNIEAAEEIVRQLRLRDIGGIIVVDFIDMVLESNRDLVVRRLLECLGRDRTKHQVAEVTSLGLVQMTRKRVGSGLIEVFSETCEHCNGRGFIIHADPVDKGAPQADSGSGASSGSHGRRSRKGSDGHGASNGGRGNGRTSGGEQPDATEAAAVAKQAGPTAAQIAAAAHAAALKGPRAADEGMEPATALEAVGSVPALAQDEPTETVRELQAEPAQQPTEPAAGQLAEPLGEETSEETSEHSSGQAPEPTPSPAPEPVEQPVRRPRRRGRVVAPAGPPGASHATHLESSEPDVAQG